MRQRSSRRSRHSCPPRAGARVDLGHWRGDALLQRFDARVEVDELELLLRIRCAQERIGVSDVAVARTLGQGVEEGVELVVLPHLERVVLAVVALDACHRQAHPSRRDGVDPITGIDGQELVGDHAALGRGRVAPVETRGDELCIRRILEQVTSQLLDRELVEGLVVVEGLDDPVAVAPHRALVVQVQPVGVRVACEVEPAARHVLAEARRGEQAVDLALVGVRPVVGEEGVQLLGRRLEAGQVVRQAAQQGLAVGLRRRLEALGGVARGEEAVDWAARPFGACVRHLGALGRDERPVLLPRRAGGDPALEGRDLLQVERLVEVGRRHDVAGILAADPADELARVRVAGDEHRERLLLHVEAHIRLALGLVGTVARVAVVGEDRPDVAREVDVLCRGGEGEGGQEEEAHDRAMVVRPWRVVVPGDPGPAYGPPAAASTPPAPGRPALAQGPAWTSSGGWGALRRDRPASLSPAGRAGRLFRRFARPSGRAEPHTP